MTPLRDALLLVALCGVAAWQVTVIPESLMQMTVGPTLAPGVIVAALSLFAVLYGISAWRGRQTDESEAPDQSPLPGANARVLSLLGGGLAFIALVNSATQEPISPTTGAAMATLLSASVGEISI